MASAVTVEPIYQMIGAKIMMMRTALGWTQEDLGKRMGLTRVSIAQIEGGKQRFMLHDISKFAETFQTTPKHFLRGIWT